MLTLNGFFIMSIINNIILYVHYSIRCIIIMYILRKTRKQLLILFQNSDFITSMQVQP